MHNTSKVKTAILSFYKREQNYFNFTSVTLNFLLWVKEKESTKLPNDG